MKKNRLLYIDILKIIACFCVIINHTQCYLAESSMNKLTIGFYSFGYAFCKIGVPIFIMASGALLLGKKYDYKKILKMIIRIIVPTIIVSVIYVIKEGNFVNVSSLIIDIIKNPVFIGLWYIYMLITLYLLTPIIQKLINNITNRDYLNIFIVSLLIPACLITITEITGLEFSSFFFEGISIFVIGYYIMGYYLSNCEMKKQYFNIALCAFISCMLLLFLSFYLTSYKTLEFNYTFDSYYNILSLLMSLSMFYIIRYLFAEHKFKKVSANIISTVAGTTFGIYLIHFMMNWEIYKYIEFIFNYNSIVGVIILEVLTFIICSLIIFIIKLIPGVKKIL